VALRPDPQKTDPQQTGLEKIDAVFKSVNRELWIVTAAAGERRGGLVATWVSQASLDPQKPVVAVGIAPNHHTAELIEESGGFALHMLRTDQAELAWNFAIGSGRDRDKLAGLAFSSGESGSPVLVGTLAWLDCRVLSRFDTGDRIFYWADIISGQREVEGEPMRVNDLIAAADGEQLAALGQDLSTDIELQRPLAEAWRAGLSGT